jgi:predicted RNA-binding protein with PUA-like domain
VAAIKAILKTEPSQFSFDDLEREGKTAWDGVTNWTALRNLETLSVGDAVAIYHTGDQRAAVGIAIVSRAAYRMHGQPSKYVAVNLRKGRRFAQAVSLDDLREEPEFADSALFRQGRLSVVLLSPAQSDVLDRLSRRKPVPAS